MASAGSRLGEIAEALPVAGRHDGQRAVLQRHRVRLGRRSGKDVEPGIAGVFPHRLGTGCRLGVPGDVLRSTPVVGSPAVGVGDDDSVGGCQRRRPARSGVIEAL